MAGVPASSRGSAVPPFSYMGGHTIFASDANGDVWVDTDSGAVSGDFTVYTNGGNPSAALDANHITLLDLTGKTTFLADSTSGLEMDSTSGNPVFAVSRAGAFGTKPAASAASALSLGAAYQNNFGYDVLLTVYLSVTVNTSGVLKLGVGPTNTPTQQTIVTGITSTGLWPVPIYLPWGYYALLSTTGTITVAVDGQIAMPV